VLKLSHLCQLQKERVDINSIQSESRLVANQSGPGHHWGRFFKWKKGVDVTSNTPSTLLFWKVLGNGALLWPDMFTKVTFVVLLSNFSPQVYFLVIKGHKFHSLREFS